MKYPTVKKLIPGISDEKILELIDAIKQDSIVNPSVLDFDTIFLTVSDVTGVSVGDIKSDSRKMAVVTARKIFSECCRKFTFYSTPKIGEQINRSHCSVLYYCQSAKFFAKHYPEFSALLSICIDRLRKKTLA